ncbi:hypothetical protein [Naasia sp. SYSU D00948]|uniref:hypothetical protein n=1 Tax=Naasia sp. SYSU D00948 TaxID=2817379 RepID=UPI001B31737A|nr:hypothetical protein [Naasia sp. SYSU D00948]
MGERDAAPPRSRLVRLAAVAASAVAYLAYAVGWAVAALRTSHTPEGALPAALYAAGELLAVASAPAWFAACLLLPRTARQRASWLAVGLVVLAPLPLLVGAT